MALHDNFVLIPIFLILLVVSLHPVAGESSAPTAAEEIATNDPGTNDPGTNDPGTNDPGTNEMPTAEVSTPKAMVQRIEWLGQAAIRLASAAGTIYLDPYKLQSSEPSETAALVLVTHSHQDHCSAEDLAKVVGEETILVAPQDCLAKLQEHAIGGKRQLSLKPGEEAVLAGATVEAVPAYNLVKTKFHPRDNGWVGYIVTVDGVRIYHLGDTERVPEMKELRCDIALVPLGQTYTMGSVEEAAAAARDVKASIAIPIHFGMYEGSAEDAARFAALLADDLEVVIKKPQP